MKNFYDGEFHFSPEENELKRVVNDAAELTDPFYDEYGVSREPKRVIYDEYAQRSGPLKQEEEGRKGRLRKYLIMQAAAIVAVVSVMFSVSGADPLGNDVLAGGGGPAAPVSPGGTSVVTPPTTTEEDDTVFPTLGNLNPDFAGDYAWSGTGTANSEEYVRLVPAGGSSYTFLVAGGAWKSMGAVVGTDSNASYDKETNTLTLNNFKGAVLDMNLMGNGFTIKLEGDNSIDQLMLWGAMYAGSVTFTGDGTLTLGSGGSAEYGLLINGEASQSCVMVKKGVKLDIYGNTAAIMIGDTYMDPAIYISNSLKLSEGEITS
ncbi:MAG: hypothetical protein J5756_06270, partial [Clostridia bacterium]|nr:hypothetical protein [Clostridia bacterium]